MSVDFRTDPDLLGKSSTEWVSDNGPREQGMVSLEGSPKWQEFCTVGRRRPRLLDFIFFSRSFFSFQENGRLKSSEYVVKET